MCVTPESSSAVSLFFSSDGLLGLGQQDIFTTVMDDQGNIQEIINLGVPINSNMDDFSFFLNDSGETGFIASNREGGMGDDDIYNSMQNIFSDETELDEIDEEFENFDQVEEDIEDEEFLM